VLRVLREPSLNQVFDEVGAPLGIDQTNDERLIELLATEYCRLFVGPGLHIPPYHSVHAGDLTREEKLLWGPEAVEMERVIREAGYQLAQGIREIPDHISVQLELMQRLTEEEQEAWSTGNAEKACQSLYRQKKLLEERMLGWIPKFCRQIRARSNLQFYRGLAIMTESFLQEDAAYIDELLG